MKLDKETVARRVRLMEEEGVEFQCGVSVGADARESLAGFDATVLAIGSTVPNNLPIPGRDMDGIHFAMEFLTQNQTRLFADPKNKESILTSKYDGSYINADGKHVVVIGGGDTGADCIGTAHRQGALSVTNLAIGKQPPSERPMDQPWPMMPNLFEMASAHEEGGERTFLASTVEFLGNDAGEVRALRVAETEYVDGRRVPKSGTEREIPADLVLIAMGFTGPERENLEQQLGAQFTSRGNVERDATYATTAPGVFVAGDAGRGQSLIVWAIAEGRAAASEVDTFLMGETVLPAPVRPTDVAIGLLPA